MTQFLELLPFPAAECRFEISSENEIAHFHIESPNAHWLELSEGQKSFGESSVYGELRECFARCLANGEDSFQIKPVNSAPVILFWGRKLESELPPSEAAVKKWLVMALDQASLETAGADQLQRRIEELNVAHDQDELALRISGRHLKAFFDESASGKALIGLDGELIFTNGALNRILQWPDLQSASFYENRTIPWSESSRAKLRENFDALLANGAPIYNLELELGVSDEQNLVFWVSLSPVLDSIGRPLYVAAEFTDVTQQVQIRRQLKVQARELESSNRELIRSNAELERFAFVASHDLQEPLRKICVFGERLKTELRKTESTEQATVYLERIVASTQRMTKLIGGVLDYSRLSQKSLSLQTVDLNGLLREMVQDFDFESADLQIGPLPPVYGNPNRLARLFANLISNSLKFRGREPLEVRIESRPELATSEFCVIEVRDNGIGFDMANANKIFDVFSRLHPRDIYDGTGIGLAICRRIANENGGDIWVESQIDRGSKFFVKLSVCKPEESQNEPFANKSFEGGANQA